jgi:hypothetical protein
MEILALQIDPSRPKGGRDAAVHIHWKLPGQVGKVAAARL